MLVDFLLIWIGWPTAEEEGGGGEALLLRETRRSPPPPNETLVILHIFAISVEQLCARSPDAPSIESLRLKFCVFCGEPARDTNGVLRLVGHGPAPSRWNSRNRPATPEPTSGSSLPIGPKQVPKKTRCQDESCNGCPVQRNR